MLVLPEGGAVMGAEPGQPPAEVAVAMLDEEPLRERAKGGDAEAQYWLGIYLAQGRWGAVDEMEAVRWIDLSATQTYIPACHALARLYQKGGLPAQRRLFVLGCLGKAADRGDAFCQTTLAALLIDAPFPQGRITAVKHLERAVAAKYPPALVQQGNWLRVGLGYPVDEMRAAEAYLQAVLTGSYEGAFQLGSLYLQGGTNVPVIDRS